jgi:integrase
LTFGPTKTYVHRTISLPGFLRTMLAEHLALPLGGDDPDALVFPSKEGGPLRQGSFYGRYFKKAAQRALPDGKRDLRFHDLRHTCVALSIEASTTNGRAVHPKLIQQRLGHSSITVTLDRYGHLFPSLEEALADALDAAFAADETRTTNVVALRPNEGRSLDN